VCIDLREDETCKDRDATTIWLFREHLTQARTVEKLFARFDKHLAKSGYPKGTKIEVSSLLGSSSLCFDHVFFGIKDAIKRMWSPNTDGCYY